MKKFIIGLLALVALLPFSRSFAQDLIYLDFEPDSIVYYPTSHLYMDFDQDGDADAYLYVYSTSGGWWFDCYSVSGWELLWCEDTITPINTR